MNRKRWIALLLAMVMALCLVGCGGKTPDAAPDAMTPLPTGPFGPATKVMGLSVAGVDILRSNHGPLVMEVNSSPGLEGIETTTGKDVASIIIDYLEKNAIPGQTRTKGRG